MQLTSPAFANNQPMPERYTCKGANISPPLTIAEVPPETQSLALIMHDPDAPSGDWVHWLVWDIPTDVRKIAEGQLPAGVQEGMTSFGTTGYGGPCPPAGTGMHRYVFELYALNRTLDLPADTTREELFAAMQGNGISQAVLTGLYGV